MNTRKEEFLRGIYQVNIGLLVVFLGFCFIGYVSDRWNLTFLIAMSLAMIIPLLTIFLGIKKLKNNNVQIKTDRRSRILIYSELVLNVLGFALLGISAYIVSIYSIDHALSTNTNRFVPHPYQYQALVLLIAGVVVEILVSLMYYYLLPKQIIAEQ